MIYKSGSSPRKEDDKKHPWHKLAEWKLKTCEALAEIVGLRLCILRLPHVYGEYDSGYFAMGVCLARIHQHDDSELRLLFSKDLKVNTLHVRDAARALWTAATWRDSKGAQLEVGTPFRFNVVDHNDTKQAHVAGILTSIFGIKVTFTNTLVSQLAKLNLDDAVDEMNEFALQAWADLLEEHHIERHGPISPFLERDVIKDRDLSIDGSSFEQTTGFKPEINFNVDTVKEIIESYKRMGWWP
jgi:nucleoside-diphosphate-sugar epimerase